jgi:hypothetical protein
MPRLRRASASTPRQFATFRGSTNRTCCSSRIPRWPSWIRSTSSGRFRVRNEIDPGLPTDGVLFELSELRLAEFPRVPASLEEGLDAVEADNVFLLAGGVFTSDLIETWIELKRRSEADEVRVRPHPWEFALYYDRRMPAS